MNSKKMLQAAVIGLGNIGFLFDLDPLRKGTWSHVTAYIKSRRVLLAGAVEVDEKKISLFHKHHDAIPVYREISDLMRHCCPDIVSICTPTASHYPILRELTQYPVKGIFCEKPLSFDIEEAAEMVRICDERGIILAVNHTRRWDDHFLYVKAVIQSGEIGNIRTINMTYPGQIFNIGTHLLDALRMLAGNEPVMVSGVAADPDIDDPDISGWLKFNDHKVCTINSVGKREDLILELDFIGDKGRVIILENGETIEKYIFQESTRYSGYNELERVPMEPVERKDRLVEAVVDVASVIMGEKDQVNCTGQDGLASLRLVGAMIESASCNGLPITLLLEKKEEDKYE